jgi:hypothetical protein
LPPDPPPLPQPGPSTSKRWPGGSAAAFKAALERADVDRAEIEAFMAEATASDYDHLLGHDHAVGRGELMQIINVDRLEALAGEA